IPCLLFTSESAGESVACLYSLLEKRVYKLTLPEPPIRSRFLIGSTVGWLVTVDERSEIEMHLLNPITGEQIALPSVHSYEYSRRTANQVLRTRDLGFLPVLFHRKAFVFFDTSTGSFIVVLIHRLASQLSFSRDEKWTRLPPHTSGYEDCTYKDGLLYAVSLSGEIHAFDLSGPAVTTKIIMGTPHDFDCESMYIVQAPWGDLLLVWRAKDFDFEDHDPDADPATLVVNTEQIKMYKVDTDVKRLVEINFLHDHVLFLGLGQSLCLNTEEYPSLNANHAYFTDDDQYQACRKNNRRDIGVLDLGNNRRENLVSPQLWSNWPTPVCAAATPSFPLTVVAGGNSLTLPSAGVGAPPPPAGSGATAPPVDGSVKACDATSDRSRLAAGLRQGCSGAALRVGICRRLLCLATDSLILASLR
ncbi:LOW QUALITY PROTEIN: hypothetical protein BRADI_3g45577v3, partial [Brachypodium distachyon]